ncbi:2-oxoacid:acceptor oxidoreductase subunit alpha [Alkaliphilus hydrothermalis]|uniref:2-oxoglutarate ferredoxin oxidoreductase subunit alpha n=1 Tax=Alkaliphilus hydrothermalis TaxID=1482730 RepID=A0ABS2NQL7_9FIRM|nr:2-oxoacid:acceptor oxidoreductase subunit alpha [Alkaliphilus hydrothermalis]MBM7615235.1 2-oxoglutarate ferredoxin oxidoreductase subunit alpha [Alkaliphilus hydrothermalis]
MNKSMSLLIGGIQGEGVISTGVSLMKALSSLGYYVYEKRDFSSRIKGGNSAITIHAGIEKKLWVEDQVKVIIALDDDTVKKYYHLLSSDGIIFYDAALTLDFQLPEKIKLIPLPITEIAKASGATLMKNTSAMGFISALLGITADNVTSAIKNKYKHKGEEIINKNITVLKNVFQYAQENLKEYQTLKLTPANKISRPLMMGNDAISLGALAAGCRFIASYPITPASEVMENLSKLLPKHGGVALQVEDEIAAVNMIIGASYGGTRSMTATSGPGLSLMMEGIGLAGMTETPIVIVDAQRSGPSTGLPTKHEQSDLIGLYFGGHGEYPSIILTPTSVEDCFYATMRAFNLAEEYQCPVFLLSDLSMSLSHQTIDELEPHRIQINRGKLYQPNTGQEEYKRYQLTEDDISPRALPGTAGGLHHTTGLEHNELGFPNDQPGNRRNMMDKRMKKTAPLQENEEIIIHSHQRDVLFLSFGSTYGVIKGAMEIAEEPLDYGYIQMIKPLPTQQLKRILEKYKHVVIVENNYSQQLATIIKSELGYHEKIHSLTKYDGTPFTLNEIITEMGGWI